jgi:hypothetical protein
MTYQKPELSVLGNAEGVILSGTKPDVLFSGDGINYTVPAYEVDE